MTKRFLVAVTASLVWIASAQAGLDTATYVSHDGNGSGSVVGDMTGVGAVTLNDDASQGDIWNGGDQFQYLHDSNELSVGFTAQVRVVSQTAAVDGRWGKAGILATSDLTGNGSMAGSMVYAGNGSQVDPPASGADHNPVPQRLSGRVQNDGNGGFEDAIVHNGTSTLPADGDGNVANNALNETAPYSVWLSLSWDAVTNEFVAGTAADVNGAPGSWNYSAPRADIFTDGDFYVGIGYSAHSNIGESSGAAEHGVTFDNYSIETVPEPSSLALLGLAVCGMLGFRRRR